MLKQYLCRHCIWVALWFVVVGIALYSRPPIPIDETRYLSVAWEMWQNGDFLVPHVNGLPYSHKPPLLFWLIHLVWAIFGVHELSARCVAPFFGLVSIFLTIGLARKLWPRIPFVGKTIPFLMLGAVSWSVFSSLTMFDTLLTTCVLLSLHSIYSASQKQSSLMYWLVTGLYLGLGILAKGPVVFVYVLPAIIFAPLWVKQKSVIWIKWYMGALFSISVGVSIALCWALPAASAGGEAYANAILLHQTADRVFHSFAHSRPFYWYVVLLPLLFFPWFFWLPSWLTTQHQWQEPGTRFCIISTAAAFFILSVISGKQMHYVLPLMPLTVLLIARNLANQQESGTVDRFPIFIILISIGIVLIVLPLIPLKGGDIDIFTKLPVWLPAILITCAIPMMFPFRSTQNSIKLISLCTVVLFIALHMSLRKPLQNMYSQHDVGRYLQKLQTETSAIAVFPKELSDQFQFAGKLKLNLYSAESGPELMRWAKNHPEGYILLFTKDKIDISKVNCKFVSVYKNGWLSILSNGSFRN